MFLLFVVVVIIVVEIGIIIEVSICELNITQDEREMRNLVLTSAALIMMHRSLASSHAESSKRAQPMLSSPTLLFYLLVQLCTSVSFHTLISKFQFGSTLSSAK